MKMDTEKMKLAAIVQRLNAEIQICEIMSKSCAKNITGHKDAYYNSIWIGLKFSNDSKLKLLRSIRDGRTDV